MKSVNALEIGTHSSMRNYRYYVNVVNELIEQLLSNTDGFISEVSDFSVDG
jgi:hypothetical protein